MLHENLMKYDLKKRNIWSFLAISKGTPTQFFERSRLVRSLERDEMCMVSIWTIFDSISLQHSCDTYYLAAATDLPQNKNKFMTLI